MKDQLIQKAKNYYLLALFAETKGMHAEAVTNYFKALFALADLELYKRIEQLPKNHTERFALLQEHEPFLYKQLDSIFFIYRETYTKEVTQARVEFIRGKIDGIFDYTKIEKPTKKDL